MEESHCMEYLEVLLELLNTTYQIQNYQKKENKTKVITIIMNN